MATAVPGAAAAAAVPPAAPAPVLPATLAEWHGSHPDPCSNAGQLLHPFRDEPNVVDAIFASLTTTTHPLPLLVNGEDGLPHVISMPFNENALPGQPMGRKHGLAGDLSTQGVTVPRTWFQLAQPQAAHTMDQCTTLWTARAINELHLGIATDGVDGAANVRMRRAMPVPHQHASAKGQEPIN